MTINPAIFKAYDIRGIYPQDINEENIAQIVKAIYTFFVQDIGKTNLDIVLGRDMRVSSPSLFEKAKEALVDLGATVIDVGLVSTPTFYFDVLHHKYDCGIQISASHNPKEYNGIKFVKRVNNTLIKIGKNTGMDRVKEIVENGEFYKSAQAGSVLAKKDSVSEEVKEAWQKVNPTHIKKIKVVADPANAMGALYLRELFGKLDSELIKMNFDLDGTFPAHQPDPLQFNTLKKLQETVLEEKADFGIAPDGDGDRVFFIDERGEVVPATLISSLIAREILRKNPKEKIIVDIRYTRNVEKICEEMKAKLFISRVGHALITEQLNKEGAAFAGESSGHFYFRETGGAESSVTVILYLLEILGRENQPLSQLAGAVQSSQESGEINFSISDHPKIILDKFEQIYKDGEVSRLDGLAVNYPDWRFNIRISNTEPLLRLNVESSSKKRLNEGLKELLELLKKLGAKQK